MKRRVFELDFPWPPFHINKHYLIFLHLELNSLNYINFPLKSVVSGIKQMDDSISYCIWIETQERGFVPVATDVPTAIAYDKHC